MKHEDGNWSQVWEPSPQGLRKALQEVRINKSSNGAYFISLFLKKFNFQKTHSNISPLKGSSLRFSEGTASKLGDQMSLPFPDSGLRLTVTKPIAETSWDGYHSDTVSACLNCYIFLSMLFKYCFNLLLYLITNKLFWRQKAESILKLKYNKLMWRKIIFKKICKSVSQCLATHL